MNPSRQLDRERYRAQLLLDEVGEAGQSRLREGRVLVVGVGGLGSPAALYLTAAGVGTVGLCDADRVEPSNLQRQILHRTASIGVRKVESAAEQLRALNPEVTIRCHAERLTPDNALARVRDYDFVIDATDNFASKFLINDAAFFADRPFCHAGIVRYSGQLMTVLPRRSACYRCLFEHPPPPGSVPTPAEVGVLGPVPGVLGSLQAVEALKFLLGLEPLLTDTLVTYDALRPGFRQITLPRSPQCPLCGSTPSITSLGLGFQPL